MAIYYTETHEWIEVNQQVATIGLTRFIQEELGEIVFVELPQVGMTVQKGQEWVVLESTKAAIDLYSPLQGEILEVNSRLKSMPSLINHSPEKEGWIVKLKFSDISLFQGLMDAKAYASLVGHQYIENI